MANIGEPRRVIEIIPLEEPLSIPNTEPVPEQEPVTEPQRVP
jgi:hypothetical protein